MVKHIAICGLIIINDPFPKNVVSGEYQGECGEMYMGDYRMMRARSPNIGEYGVNTHHTAGPYHRVAGYLVETEDCNLESNAFSQPNCPDENKNGFYLTDELSPDWADLDQTQILIYHSWINEYVRVANVTAEEDGRLKVMFQEPLAHAAVGVWIKSGDLRYPMILLQDIRLSVSARNSKFHHLVLLALLVALVTCSPNFHHRPLLALLVVLVLH